MYNFQPTASDVAFWDFAEIQEVTDLSRQLHDGLIHPIEYAELILGLADKEGLGAMSGNKWEVCVPYNEIMETYAAKGRPLCSKQRRILRRELIKVGTSEQGVIHESRLIGAFNWSRSPQGRDFWNSLNRGVKLRDGTLCADLD